MLTLAFLPQQLKTSCSLETFYPLWFEQASVWLCFLRMFFHLCSCYSITLLKLQHKKKRSEIFASRHLIASECSVNQGLNIKVNLLRIYPVCYISQGMEKLWRRKIRKFSFCIKLKIASFEVWNRNDEKLLQIVLSASKKAVMRKWLEWERPTIDERMQIIHDIYIMERRKVKIDYFPALDQVDWGHEAYEVKLWFIWSNKWVKI